MPWFRLYNETLTDRKIARICRESKQPKALVLGVWVTFLTLASESPHRGYLLISDDLAISTDEIREETGLDEDTFNRIVEGLTFYGMVERENHCWLVCNWEGRQPAGDDSKQRVQRYREKRKQSGMSAASTYDRHAILARDYHECVYCGSKENLCVDHVYPIRQGGTDADDNLAAACKKCNSGKSGRTPEEAGYEFINKEAEERYHNYLISITVTEEKTPEDVNGDSNFLDTELETDTEQETEPPLTPPGGARGTAPPKKSGGGRPKKQEAKDCPIPEPLGTTAFLDHWRDWLKHRSEIRKPVTYTAAEKQLRQLEKWGLQRAIIAIDHSIANGWQGIFEPKAGVNGHGRPQAKQSSREIDRTLIKGGRQ